ncbi:MAG: LON peptidase substrate-binding domain-containing protein [Phycisphaerae bacterium]|nr:LON peptidase substrate-binding domain-containing protein [Phycisphaerae bacterium]
MCQQTAKIDFDKPIAIFPLPNCVLLPRAILPLHIFEPRYREMVGDSLTDQGLVAMALLRPGYEEKYYTHSAPIDPIVCVGSIVRHESITEGRYNILLQGRVRATVVREDRERPYRRGILAPQTTADCGNGELTTIRQRLLRVLESPSLRQIAAQSHWPDLLHSSELPISDAVDFLASLVACNVDCARRFLLEMDVARRADLLVKELSEFVCRISTARSRPAERSHSWPRSTAVN